MLSEQEKEHRFIFFVVTAGILLVINVIGSIWSYNAGKEYTKYESLLRSFQSGDYLEDDYENVIFQLESGVKIIGDALNLFILRLIISNVCVAVACVLPRKLFDIAKEDIVKYLWDFDDLPFTIVEVIIVVVFVWDIYSSFDDIAKYWDLMHSMDYALNNIFGAFERILENQIVY